ncbi:LOB domain-containing protein 1-like [Dorcoceras hygrometricum]|uniref:LOB domain-containing protein 1-like n=1 Tax=Dorcoceras hygrometricum TaxID=472368 RepID=A0A2Z7AIB7_9LAMI|nr:LOB domain-containing protein 1-like [Dorcoceras hygrometricum]
MLHLRNYRSHTTTVDNTLPAQARLRTPTSLKESAQRVLSVSKQPSQISESKNRVVESASAAYLVEEPIEETEQNQGTEIADAVPTVDTKISDDESMTLEEHLSTIPDGSSFPSTTGEVTKIQFGKIITIRGVDEGDWYKASLPKIPAAAKGKAPLQEKDPIKGNPAKEIFSLNCADIEVLVQLREKVIDDVHKFFNSFSFKRLDALKIEDIYAKEEQVLIWAETDSTRIALQRKMYILTKYRELLLRKLLEARKTNFVPGESSSDINLQVLAMLSNLHLFVLEELKTEMQAHGLIWEMTCCSRLFEGPNRDRGAVIARSNENIRSSCWIRTMIRVDGSWVIEPCADYWKPLRRRLIQHEILPQIAYVVTLPPVSYFFKLFKKRWADVCIEAAEFFMFGKLLHMGSLNFYRALTIVKPAQQFDSRRPTVTTWVFTESFAQLRDSISQISIKQVQMQRSLDDLKSELLFKIENLAKASAEARDQQTQYIHNSIKSVHQEARTQGDVLSVKLNEYQKGTRTHHALVTTDLEDIRKEVKAMDEQLATIRSEMLDFRSQAKENHLNLSTQLGFLVDYINRGGDAKKGEGGSSRPQPPPDDQSRPSGGNGSIGSGGDGSNQRRDRSGSSKKRHSSSSGGVHHSSGGGGPVGPIRRDAEYWICGKRQF